MPIWHIVPTLGQRFFDILACLVVILTGADRCGHLNNSGKAERGAFLLQDMGQCSRGFVCNGFSKAFFSFDSPGFFRNNRFLCPARKGQPRHVLHIKGIAQGKQMICQLRMLAFSGFCLTILKIFQLILDVSVPLGFVACQLDTSPDRPILRIVVRICCPSAPIQLPL